MIMLARTEYELAAIALVIIGFGTAIGADDAVHEDGGSWLLGDSHIQRELIRLKLGLTTVGTFGGTRLKVSVGTTENQSG